MTTRKKDGPAGKKQRKDKDSFADKARKVLGRGRKRQPKG